MEQNMMNDPRKNDLVDLMKYVYLLKSKIVWIILSAMILGALSFAYTTYRITPLYQASIRMIVNQKRDAYTSLSVSDVTSAEGLVATYATVIKSNRIMDRVIEKLNLNMNWNELNSMVSVNPVDNTPVVDIIVTNKDPDLARRIVNTISEVAPELIVDAVEAGSCKVISDANVTGSPVYPNVKKNTQKGMLAGAAFCAGLIILISLLDDRIQSEEQLTELIQAPVLSTIPQVGKKTKTHKKNRKRKRS